MIRLRIPAALLICLAATVPCRAATSIVYTRTKAAGVYINLVTINLNDRNVRVTPAIARCGIGTCESFRSMMRRTRPAAAINGTFFCTKTLSPTGDIVIDGNLLSKGSVGTAVAIDVDNKITFLPAGRPDLYHWWDYQHVVAAGPALILRAKTIVMPRAQGFRSRVHFAKERRAAVGLTSTHKLVFVTCSRKIHLRTLARVMRSLRCTDAATLDGGSSIGLYCKGKLITNPGRGMTNCLLVYDNPSEYEQRRECFFPTLHYTSAPPSGS